MQPAQLADRYSHYIEAHQFDALASIFAPDVCLRALTPGGAATHEGSDAAVARIRQWFGPWSLKLLDHRIDEVGGRCSILNRYHASIEGRHAVVEQHAYATTGEQGFESIDLLCSGFRPIVIADGLHYIFDAGDLGCGDGFAAEFRRQLNAIPVGAVLEVIARDPAAREDLPPLARMLGNRVLDVQQHDDGRTVALVEKSK